MHLEIAKTDASFFSQTLKVSKRKIFCDVSVNKSDRVVRWLQSTESFLHHGCCGFLLTALPNLSIKCYFLPQMSCSFNSEYNALNCFQCQKNIVLDLCSCFAVSQFAIQFSQSEFIKRFMTE